MLLFSQSVPFYTIFFADVLTLKFLKLRLTAFVLVQEGYSFRYMYLIQTEFKDENEMAHFLNQLNMIFLTYLCRG